MRYPRRVDLKPPPFRWRDMTPVGKIVVSILALVSVMGALVVILTVLFIIALIVTHGTINVT